MAVIELQAGEVFSHTHDVVTTTALVDGEIELTMNGVTMRLTKTPVVVPASTPHVLRNVGTTIARFACGGYGAGGESG